MNKSSVTTMSAAVLGLALATSAAAQQQQQQDDFPSERTSAGSCADVDWNEDIRSNHSSLIDACQEVISVDGETWARFDAKFVRIESNGDVIFSVRDERDRAIEEVTLDPSPGQVAYINDRATPFSSLRTTDSISLYVPEGEYGFATQPGVGREELASVVNRDDSTRSDSAAQGASTTTDRTVAQRDTNTRSDMLPSTASSLPWLALAGLLSIFAGLSLTLRRRS